MNNTLIGILSLLVVLLILCCCCLGIIMFSGVAGSFFLNNDFEWSSYQADDEPKATPVVIRPSGSDDMYDEKANELWLPVNSGNLHETLHALETAIVPVNDLIDLAKRLEGKTAIPRMMESSNSPLIEGSQETFWMIDTDSDVHFPVNAVLRYVTDHLYFWVEDGLSYSESDLAELADTFETEIYPVNRRFFGSEWTPGVDGDEHLYIIYASGLGDNLAGYFSSADEYHPLAHEYSNAHETFVLNYDTLDLDDPYTYGVLAHEFQHMIHWYQDRNETTWLNEGFSELATFLNGYDPGGFDYLFALNPDMQLTYWPDESEDTASHYGAAFLFVAYFLDRFGEEATQALVKHPLNGMTSIDEVLDALDTIDPTTGQEIYADDVFIDWAVANLTQDRSIGNGQFDYYSYKDLPDFEETETIRSCQNEIITRDVHQYGVDYIRFTCPTGHDLTFEGSIQVDILPVDSHSGSFAFWSNRGDESNMKLTRSFDFADTQEPIELSYWTWFDIEEDYDYVYLEASVDGTNWDILTTPSGTIDDPSGNSYGWGYNGKSGLNGEWIKETIDLSEYAGEEIYLRFEYVTDGAVNAEGLLIDDVSIPAIGYFTDFEEDNGGWQGEGFVRISGSIPQEFRLALITYDNEIRVYPVTLQPDNTISISIPEGVDESILVVAGVTRYTRQKAAYRILIEE